MTLKDLGNTPFRLSVLDAVYPGISQMAWKAKRLEDSGDLIRLKRGLFVVSPSVSGERLNDFLLANHIYGPSYVSMQSALRYYGLIPESVYSTTSVTLGTTKTFVNKLGTFTYVHSPENYFPIGITGISEGNTAFLIASPEKALCDLLMFTPNLNLRYAREVTAWLENNLRFDMDRLHSLDTDILRECAEIGRKKPMINHIVKLVEK